eukprot:7048437-Alexandrium_andersonii.AAC.1
MRFRCRRPAASKHRLGPTLGLLRPRPCAARGGRAGSSRQARRRCRGCLRSSPHPLRQVLVDALVGARHAGISEGPKQRLEPRPALLRVA